MTRYVLDASVALKWVLREPGREQAISFLSAFEAGEVDLLAPGIIMAEVASALSKLCRRKKIGRADATQAFHHFEQRRPKLVDDLTLIPHALSLSLKHQLSLWDCLYLAIAIETRTDLITSDARLHRAVSRHYPFVQLIGVARTGLRD